MKIYKTQWEAPDMEQTSLFERRVPQPLAARLRGIDETTFFAALR